MVSQHLVIITGISTILICYWMTDILTAFSLLSLVTLCIVCRLNFMSFRCLKFLIIIIVGMTTISSIGRQSAMSRQRFDIIRLPLDEIFDDTNLHDVKMFQSIDIDSINNVTIFTNNYNRDIIYQDTVYILYQNGHIISENHINEPFNYTLYKIAQDQGYKLIFLHRTFPFIYVGRYYDVIDNHDLSSFNNFSHCELFVKVISRKLNAYIFNDFLIISYNFKEADQWVRKCSYHYGKKHQPHYCA